MQRRSKSKILVKQLLEYLLVDRFFCAGFYCMLLSELASLEGTAVFAFNFHVIAGHYGNFQISKGALRQY